MATGMNESTSKIFNVLSEIGLLDKGKNYQKVELTLSVYEAPILKTEEVIIKDDFGKFSAEHIFKAKFIDIEE